MSPDLFTALANYGLAGVVLFLLVFGFLITKAHATDLRAEIDSYRRAFEAEKEAHAKSREALAEALDAVGVAQEQATMTIHLLEALGHPLGGRDVSTQ